MFIPDLWIWIWIFIPEIWYVWCLIHPYPPEVFELGWEVGASAMAGVP
jgi:hypothetical protein